MQPRTLPADRLAQGYNLLSPCRLCPRRCGVDRLAGQVGFCGVGRTALVSSAGPHFGEESCLVGAGGSGTIFLAGCNLGCIFCQNYDISHLRHGQPASPQHIADLMLALARTGCENINFVTPTHVAPHLVEAVQLARAKGLTLPIVWNCGGYESLETLRFVEGSVDIYMPDAKYAHADPASRFSAAPDYPQVAHAALKEMHRQVGDLVLHNGVATRGLLVRHLVLPNNLAGTQDVIDFLADDISPDTYVNVMGQYRPEFHASDHPELARRPTPDEIAQARRYAARRGLRLAD
jgi:putative pyruvate formate lyase activating enzyme